jgi:antirestriction protein ArdC
MRKDAYDIVTERIIDIMNQGVVPWRQGWTGGGRPCNLVTGKPYRGINVFVLALSGYSSRYWLTFNQAKKKGGSVRKGEKGTPVVFWKWLEKETEDSETGEKTTDRIPLLRYYTVFNLEQTHGIEDSELAEKPEISPIDAAQAIISNMPRRPAMVPGRPAYNAKADIVSLPTFKRFDRAEDFYSTAFHELAHSTGHGSRLGRKEVVEATFFGDPDYSKEELVAEMTAAYLSNEAGITTQTLKNSAAYIKGWLEVFSGDRKMLVCAAAAAQKAADFILNIRFED